MICYFTRCAPILCVCMWLECVVNVYGRGVRYETHHFTFATISSLIIAATRAYCLEAELCPDPRPHLRNGTPATLHQTSHLIAGHLNQL